MNSFYKPVIDECLGRDLPRGKKMLVFLQVASNVAFFRFSSHFFNDIWLSLDGFPSNNPLTLISSSNAAKEGKLATKGSKAFYPSFLGSFLNWDISLFSRPFFQE